MEEKLFDLVSTYTPQGDQPQAIDKLVEGIRSGEEGAGAARRDRHGKDLHDLQCLSRG